MSYRLESFAESGIDEGKIERAVREHDAVVVPKFERLWSYYRNALQPVGKSGGGGGSGEAKWYRQAQEAGLPSRVTGVGRRDVLDERSARREVVVENDIAWRVQAMVDFVFGKPVRIESTASDPSLRVVIEKVLDHVWEQSGGIGLLQDAGILGHVYGHVDFALRGEAAKLRAWGEVLGEGDLAGVLRASELLRVEVIEPTRGIALLDPHDYRRIVGYLIRARVGEQGGGTKSDPWWHGVSRIIFGEQARRDRSGEVMEILGASAWQVYQGGALVWEQREALTPGRVPVVHVQNISQPFEYEGQGEVEPLIPLQDELNTRLSDRASRVTLQSFQMYLAKGLEGFDKGVVGPGRIWYTDNMDASVQAFGGDADAPSEEQHIVEIREALDKISSVPPLAGGVVQAKVGSLSSANALKITLMGLIAKTQRKRVAYGRGIVQMCELILSALDASGVLRTDPENRGIRLAWEDPLPIDVREQMAAAESKLRVGVSEEKVLEELGYRGDPGVV